MLGDRDDFDGIPTRPDGAQWKLFPAEATGGLANLSALSAVFPTMRFMPTGGIGPDNAGDYLRHPAVLAIGGSWMTPTADVDAGDWASITDAARAAADLGRSR